MSSPRRLGTLCAYAVEGGFDGPFEPATCFSPTIALGHTPRPQPEPALWSSYERVLDAVGDLGLDGIRLDVSWARIEPRRGSYDESALARYRDVIAYAHARDLWVTIAAVDAAWPSWLGLEAWLLPWTMPVTVDFVTTLAHALPEADGLLPFADEADLVSGFLDATSPPWRSGAVADAASARAQLRLIRETLSAVPALTERWVRVEDETYSGALVAGSGALRADGALLTYRQGAWVATV